MLPPPPDHPRRLAYLGSPTAAVAPLRALHAAGHDIVAVVSQPDRRRGRGGATVPSPVKAAALELGLPVDDSVDTVLDRGAELGVVVAYGRIIPVAVLARLPMVNLHFSLLPRWRGAAPVERAILAGDERTGVCLMAVEEGLDTGGVYRRAEVAIGVDETASELTDRLVEVGIALLVDALDVGFGPPRPQEGAVTYAAKLTPADRELHWDRPAAELARVVRIGGAWTTFRGRRLKVVRARVVDDPPPAELDPADPAGAVDGVDPADAVGTLAGTLAGTVVRTGAGGLELVEVQPEGKGLQDAGAWRNGARPRPGELLGS